MSDITHYSEHYARLEQIATQLSRQDRVDIDQLLPMIDDAMASYQFCKNRIDAVEKLLAAKLQTVAPSAVDDEELDD
jgi:exodeoxyribonuclease VII small subunit